MELNPSTLVILILDSPRFVEGGVIASTLFPPVPVAASIHPGPPPRPDRASLASSAILRSLLSSRALSSSKKYLLFRRFDGRPPAC